MGSEAAVAVFPYSATNGSAIGGTEAGRPGATPRPPEAHGALGTPHRAGRRPTPRRGGRILRFFPVPARKSRELVENASGARGGPLRPRRERSDRGGGRRASVGGKKSGASRKWGTKGEVITAGEFPAFFPERCPKADPYAGAERTGDGGEGGWEEPGPLLRTNPGQPEGLKTP